MDSDIVHETNVILRKNIRLLIFGLKKTAVLKKYRHACSDETQSLSGFTGMKNYFTQWGLRGRADRLWHG